ISSTTAKSRALIVGLRRVVIYQATKAEVAEDMKISISIVVLPGSKHLARNHLPISMPSKETRICPSDDGTTRPRGLLDASTKLGNLLVLTGYSGPTIP